jgi:hypothetical protein
VRAEPNSATESVLIPIQSDEESSGQEHLLSGFEMAFLWIWGALLAV